MDIVDFVTGRDVYRDRREMWDHIKRNNVYPEVSRGAIKTRIILEGVGDVMARGMELGYSVCSLNSMMNGKYMESAIEAVAFAAGFALSVYRDALRRKMLESVRDDSFSAFVLRRKGRG